MYITRMVDRSLLVTNHTWGNSVVLNYVEQDLRVVVSYAYK